jgi:hypothetical protein
LEEPIKKSLEFSAKLDLNDFDRSIQQTMQKLRQLTSSQEMMQMQRATAQKLGTSGTGATLSQPSMDAFNRASQQFRRDMNQFVREQTVAQEKLGKQIASRISDEKRLTDELSKRIQGTKEYLDLEQKISRHKENTYRMEQQYRQRDKTLNDSLTASSGGGGRPPSSMLRGMAGAAGFAGGIAGAIGSAGNYYTGLPIQSAMAQGNASQGLFGKDLSSLASGNVVGFNAFMPERYKALAMANQKMQTQPTWDFLSGVSGMDAVRSLLGGGNGRASDLAMSLITKGAGGLFGGGMMDQAMEASGGTSFRQSMGGMSDRFNTSYQSKLMEDFAGNYQNVMDAERKKNPLKNLASDYLQQNYQRDLLMQRSLGLNYGTYHGAGGFREQANLSGFNDNMAIEAAQGILGAGGSTRSGRGGAISALQAQRGFDLTNAPGVLGRVSGRLGDNEASNNALKRILADSFSDGLDNSDFRQEQRKYAEIAAGAIAASGASNSTDVENTLRNIRSYMGGETTIGGLQSSANAYESSQQIRSQTSGRAGALQFSSMMSDPVLGKLSPLEMSGLAELRPEHLTTGNMLIQSAADSAGVSPQELIDRLQKTKKSTEMGSMMLSSQTTQPLFDYMKQNNMTDIPSLSDLRAGGAGEDVIGAFKAYSSQQTMLPGYVGDEKYQRARLRGLRGPMDETSPESMQYVTDKMGSTETGRIEDKVVQATGAASQAFLENFRQFKDVITPASDAIGGLTKQLVLLTAVASGASDADRPAMLKGAADQMRSTLRNRLSAPVQPQSGKPKVGGPSEY